MHHDDASTGSIRAASAGVGRHVDIHCAVASAVGALAAACWALTVLLAVRTDGDPVVITAAIAATLSAQSVLISLTGINRRYVRTIIDNDVTIVCRRLDALAEKLDGQRTNGANGTNGTNGANGNTLADDWRVYLAGRLDAPHAPDH